MDRARAKKTLDFKAKMIDEPATSRRARPADSGRQWGAPGTVDARRLLEAHSDKDRLFLEK